MRIVFLSDDYPPKSLGGAGVVASLMAGEFVRRGNEVFVITATSEKKFSCETRNGVKIYSIPSHCGERWRAYSSLYNFQTVKKVEEILEEIKPDVVHAHNLHTNLSYACLATSKKNCRKVFVTAHDAMMFHYGKFSEFIDSDGKFFDGEKPDYKISGWQLFKKYKARYNPFRNTIIRHYLSFADKIFSVSDALKEALVQNGIKNVETIHNGVDLSAWACDKERAEDFAGRLGIFGKKVILFGGRLSEGKGSRVLLEAAEKIFNVVSDAILLIIGRKEKFEKNTEKLLERLHIKDKVVYAGWLSGLDLVSAYFSSKLVVTPSVYLDPFPTINLEAMACKLPVVGTCFGGTPEVVKNGETGFVVNPFDIENMSEKIIYLLQNPEKAKNMGAAGYDRVGNFFSLKSQVDKLASEYKLL